MMSEWVDIAPQLLLLLGSSAVAIRTATTTDPCFEKYQNNVEADDDCSPYHHLNHQTMSVSVLPEENPFRQSMTHLLNDKYPRFLAVVAALATISLFHYPSLGDGRRCLPIKRVKIMVEST
jgi:hypothetical protein